MNTFQSRLKQSLEEARISQSELARRAKIDKTLISGYVLGKFKPKQNNVYKIAKALNIDEAWLIGISDKKERDPLRQEDSHSGHKSLDEMAEEYSKQFRSYGDKPISEEQRKAIKEITIAYLKSQGINDSSEDQ
ncbi:helix-turn-helix domain-containing protein [Limosilactobacillus coleohominis]|uniref:helix-turn-helix domain-containing protein n=1 Tax=Limosilactobacillus coleohominis TaxID=181675 RepID=UPI0026ECD665|nr:helix-turn-helix transcriptional regulator [Limosilactobacillus coleohominis]